ncbi:MAG TPA: alpha/beta fold hydrolase [Dongiaceae bacterium]|nr:alpha/beta fold hydrolase [Dongiaceae bacterium]
MPSQTPSSKTQAETMQAEIKQPHRLGPQPLPLHLSLALTTWSNSAAILPSLMLAWQRLKAQRPGESPVEPEGAAANPRTNPGSPRDRSPFPPLPAKLEQALRVLGPQLDAADPAALARALSEEGLRRLDAFVSGTLAYRQQPTPVHRPPRPVLWSAGTTRLLDYRLTPAGQSGAPRILVIPSLINRYHILDLAPEASFLDFLATAGCQPFVVDWGAPGKQERDFSLTDYIAGRLQDAYRALQQEPGGPIFVVGYCMGGLLALALTQLLQQSKDLTRPAGLVLLATPWDFHAEQADQAAMIATIGRQLEPIMAALGELPVDLLQSFFALLDPFQVPRKFQAFAALSRGQTATDAAVQRFTLLEDWLNDGIGLAADVARECLIGWYGTNNTRNGSWRVGGNIIDPRQIAVPSLALIPDRDRIVPPGSALALAEALPNHDIARPPAGHIGMMAGSKARSVVWPQIVEWIHQRVPASQDLASQNQASQDQASQDQGS